MADQKKAGSQSAEADETKFNETLKRMLQTPPQPHNSRSADEHPRDKPSKKTGPTDAR